MAVSLPRKLWEHPNPEGTRMGVFRRKLEKTKGVQLPVSVPVISKRRRVGGVTPKTDVQ